MNINAGASAPRAALIAATVAIVIFELVVPITVQQVYDRFIPDQSVNSLKVLASAAIACLLAEAVLRWLRGALVGRQGASFSHRAGCHVMRQLLNGEVDEAQHHGVGSKLALLNLVRSYRETGSGQRIITFAEMAVVPLTLGLIAVIAGPLVLVPLTLIGGFILLSYLSSRRLYQAKEARQKSDSERIDLMVELMGAAQTIKALAAERIMVGRYELKKYQSSVDHLEVSRQQTQLFDLTSTFGTLLIFSVILAGAYLTVEGTITAGAMIAAIILSGRSMPPLQKALAMLNRRQEHQVEAQQVRELLRDRQSTTRIAWEDCPDNSGALELRDVSLDRNRTSGDTTPLLSAINLNLAPFETSVIHAPTHGELTRVFHMIAGLIPTTGGQVLLNGEDVSRLPDTVRATQIGYLGAETTLYRGTIMDNLSRFGSVPTTDVLFIAKQLKLDEDLQILPRGFDTFLRGDAGDPVPPGLRQRIALARALAPRPKVILFDHADTGLDRSSYTALYELFARLRGHATVLLASNDGTLCGLAQHSYTLRDGQLVADTVNQSRKLAVSTYKELRI